MADKSRVVLQNVTREKNLPSIADFKRWINAALDGRGVSAEVTVRIVDEDEGRMLNRRYRHKDSPTNVLSFATQLPAEVASPMLGDLVMCAPVIMREAAEQGKRPDAHWAHLTIHGTLHLLGYQHDTGAQAKEMESFEILILAHLGYPDPYN
jgi:probable rRNA maturation factor